MCHAGGNEKSEPDSAQSTVYGLIGVRYRYSVGEIIEYREQKGALGYKDVLDHLKSAGFKLVKGYKDFAKNPATPEEFSIFVCQK